MGGTLVPFTDKVKKIMRARLHNYSNPVICVIRGQKRHKTYPFTAIVGQEEMKLALILNVVDPLIGGVLIMGHRGTGKSTAVRGLADLLPQITVVAGCPYNCDPQDTNLCDQCSATRTSAVELPTTHRRCLSLNFRWALLKIEFVARSTSSARLLPAAKHSIRVYSRANRGFLYIDEVNLLEDHLVDLLLDVAARESIKLSAKAFRPSIRRVLC